MSQVHEQSHVGRRERIKLRIQTVLGQLFVLPLGLLIVSLIRFRLGLSIHNHREIRGKFKEIAQENSPLVICANHLTLIDSVIIMWSLASIPQYVRRYRMLSWNIPARENYCRRPTWRLITYLAKCIPVDRAGSREHLDSVLGTLSYLLHRGHACMIFPEGTRSRSGRLATDNVGYGVGKLIARTPQCRVLCVYQRGDHQQTYSDFPKKGEQFHVELALLKPQSVHTGLRAVRDYTTQVVSVLKDMEARYFAEAAS